jgi:hypothetical protein
MYERGLIKIGSRSIGRNRPQRNIMGNLKKLENVCASNTSLTETAMKRPRNVDVTAMRNTPTAKDNHATPDKSTKNEAIITGIKALTMPKTIAPVVLAIISRFRLMGESSNRSKERLLRSNVMVTESIDVVPNNTDRAITPGRMSLISTGESERTKNINVQEMGKMIPQLMFGGLR